MMWPFGWKLSACTFTWCHFFLKILQNKIWNFGRNLPLAIFGSERVNENRRGNFRFRPHLGKSGFGSWNSGIRKTLFVDLESWTLESGIQPNKSASRQMIELGNPSSIDKNPESSTLTRPRSGVHTPFFSYPLFTICSLALSFYFLVSLFIF